MTNVLFIKTSEGEEMPTELLDRMKKERVIRETRERIDREREEERVILNNFHQDYCAYLLDVLPLLLGEIRQRGWADGDTKSKDYKYSPHEGRMISEIANELYASVPYVESLHLSRREV